MSRNIPALSALQARFNLRPFLAARHLRPEVYGTMDTSFEWPLNVVPQLLSVAPGTIAAMVSAVTGKHSLCVYAMVQNINGLAGDQLQLFLGPPDSTLSAQICIFSSADSGAAGSFTPIVGARALDARGMLEGVKAVYVPEGQELNFAYTSAGADNARLRFAVLTVPSNQPLSSLFNYS